MRLTLSKKMRRYLARLAASVLLCAAALAIPLVAQQNPETMMPEESEAKGRQILQDLINALGGPGYMEVKASDCEGRRASFGHNGELTGYINFKDYWLYPDKNRTDFSKKGVIINLYDGDKGWTLDKGGVSELPATTIADFQEQTKRDINNLLRLRLNEPGMVIRYGGLDIVDLKTVDWVNLTDSEQRNFRLAVDHSSHLLVRSMVITGDPEEHQQDTETFIYTNYQLMGSVYTPLQITLDRNGRRVNQVFYQVCKFNPDLPADLFTKAALTKRFSEVGSKKYKNEKKKEKEDEKADN